LEKPPQTLSKFDTMVGMYKSRPIQRRDLYLPLFLGLISIFIPLCYGLFRTIYGYAQHGVVIAFKWGFPWLITTVLVSFLVAGLFYWQLRIRRQTVFIYMSGLRIHSNFFTNLKLSWDELLGISVCQEKFGTDDQPSYNQVTLLRANGRPIKLYKDLDHLNELLTRIKASIYPRLLTILKRDFSNGHIISFGPVSLDKSKLYIQKSPVKIGNMKFPWKEIDQITIRSGYLVVELKTNKSIQLNSCRIPNIELLLEIIRKGWIL
jgi:hypothetical protein